MGCSHGDGVNRWFRECSSLWLSNHITDLSAQIAWFCEGLFVLSSCLTKISILLFYRRLIERAYSRAMQLTIYIAIALTVAYFIIFYSFLIFVCNPSRAVWESLNISYREPYQCINRREADPLAGIISVVSDAYALIIPEVIISRLKMPTGQKIVLYCIFSCGVMCVVLFQHYLNILTSYSVIAAGIARTYWLVQLHSSKTRDLTCECFVLQSLYSLNHLPGIGYEIFLWSLIEMHFSIICASAPALKGVFTAFWAQPYSNQKASNSGSNSAQKRTVFSSEDADWPLSNVEQNQKSKAKADWGTIVVTERFSVRSLNEKQKRILGID
jgi:hypothetical protein